MRLRYLCATILTLAVLATASFDFAGCGGGDESYAEVIRGLKRAAMSNAGYDAVSRASGMSRAERASLESFCNATQRMLVAGEGRKIAETRYYISRISTDAEASLDFPSTDAVDAAVAKLNGLFGLRSFDGHSARPFARACFH